MQAEELPLFELYTRLQEAGLPLGLNEYTQLLKALQGGFGLPDRQALSHLCCTLWVKNEEEEHIFNYHFAEVIGVKPTSYKDIAETSAQKSTLYQEITSAQNITVQTNRKLLIGIFVLLVVFLATLGGLKFLSGTPENESPPSESPNPTVPTEIEGEFIPGQPLPNAPEDLEIESMELPKIPITFLSSLVGLMLLSSTVSWFFIRQITVTQTVLPTEDFDDFTIQDSVSKTEIFTAGNDEVQLAETIRKTNKEKASFSKEKVIGQDEYFPLTRRQMKQGWRYLRQNKREGPKTEFDLDETVSQIARQGSFLRPIMKSARSSRTDLILLIDQDGSMIPFQALAKRLVETATRAGRLGNADTYYFHNCPTNHLYHNPTMQNAEPLINFLSRRLSPKSIIVIMSDAGAARGGLSTARIKRTKEFIGQINQYARYIVWLNPVPRNRWELTTAGELSKLVPMFEINRAGFHDAVDVLRGRWKPSLENLRTTL
ncbi:MAG: hypothetical protein AAF821_20870 [Cyanobacteria bacterium P01_D01_bin.156]